MKAWNAFVVVLGLVGCGDGDMAGPSPFPNSHWNAQRVDVTLPQEPVKIQFPPQAGAGEIKPVQYLELEAGALRFNPSPLYAISIYKGEWSNYDEALVTANPVATVAAQNCTNVKGQCLVSPLPISQCQGCEKILVGEVYTAFLLREASEMLDEVLAVPVKGTPP